MKKNIFFLILFLFIGFTCFSQKENINKTYPKIVGFISFVHPLVSFDKNATTYNFSGSYTVGLPMGINILKSDKIGFSFQLTPFIKAQHDTSKVSSIVFEPGAMFRFKHSFTIITRLSFETTGRYGLTPVFNKVLAKAKNVSYFAAISVPLRLGNDKPYSVGFGLQLGLSF